MSKYRKKPVVIDAFRLPEGDADPDEFMVWASEVGFVSADYTSERDGSLAIHTLEGIMLAGPGDWIIRGVQGEFYPCKHEIFEATYDPVEPDQ